MILRGIKRQLLASLEDSPSVYLQGARQTGKSTLAKSLADGEYPARYLTLDNAGVLAAAESDPRAFVAGIEGPTIIDEVQRARQLPLAIKESIDARRVSGRFLLTGSANVVLLPRVASALAGRIEIHTLWPFSQGELGGSPERFIDDVFRTDYTPPGRVEGEDWQQLFERILKGGFPEIVRRRGPDRRRAWFGSYVTTILQREVRDLSSIEDLGAMPRLLALLGARVGSLLNYAELSRSLSMPQTTLKRYMALLEGAFLIQMLPAWSSNLGKRLVKSPKLQLVDTGLLCHLIGANSRRLMGEPRIAGQILENFVAMELRKHLGWSQVSPRLFHFQTQTGQEVDIVLEDCTGKIVGVEVKSSAAVKSSDFRGLRALREMLGDQFLRGFVLYAGSEVLSFGTDLFALPVSGLWHTR